MIDRFKLILEKLKLTPSEFADRIGVQRSNISHVLSGRNKPGIDFLEKMLNTFPEIDIAWLITGKASQRPISPDIGFHPLPVEEKTVMPIELPEVSVKKTLLPQDGEAVNNIIIVFKNNTFRILNPE
jgi:transcriptional regulator with XRE-family HTH domain